LDFSLGTLTVEDGPGDDIDIQTGGVFILSLASTPPNFVSKGYLQCCNGRDTQVLSWQGSAAAACTGVNAINFVYNHQSVLEYTLVASFRNG
jgi:hypothetical protein